MRGRHRGGRFRLAVAALIVLTGVRLAAGATTSTNATGAASATTSPAASALPTAVPTPFGPQLLKNGDLSKGSEGQPDDWRTEAWVNDPGDVNFTWTHPPNGGPGQLEVDAVKANDARWMESLSLTPGWYYISADIRTENIGTQGSGATISVMEDGVMSPEVKATSDWTHVGMYVRVGKKGADVDIGLRVGGFGSLNTGKGFYRNASVMRIDAPPAGAQPTYDLEKIRQEAQPVPIGQPYSLVLTYLLLIAIGYAGWYVFAMEPPKVARSEARRATRKKAARR